jgi:hypothetical protein
MSDLFPHNIERDASVSACGKYRWTLSREWDPQKQWVGWVMLNPSTADAAQDDPTIRRCIGFARAWGFGGLAVRNLFALRATDPAVLIGHPDPVGAGNVPRILDLIEVCPLIVVAWGALAKPFHAHAQFVLSELTKRGAKPMCLALTADGWPRHPLYVRKDVVPFPYKLPAKGKS